MQENGGKRGKWGKVGKNSAEVGDTWGGGGGGEGQSMGPLSQCCLFSPMDHVHPYKKRVRYIPLKVVRDSQRGWVSTDWLSNFPLVSTISPIPPQFPPISHKFPHYPPLPHIFPISPFSLGTLLGTLLHALCPEM